MAEINITRYDIISIILLAIATSIGVSIGLLPTPIPGPLSMLSLAGIAVFLTSISALIQAAVDPSQSEQVDHETIELSREAYRTNIENAHQSGYSQGRSEVLQEYNDTLVSQLNTSTSTRYESSPPFSHSGTKSQIIENIKEMEKEIDAIKHKMDEIDSSDRSNIEAIESQVESLSEKIDDVEERTPSEVDLLEIEGEINRELEANRDYIRGLYVGMKSNVDGFGPSEEVESDDSEKRAEYSEDKEQKITEKELE